MAVMVSRSAGEFSPSIQQALLINSIGQYPGRADFVEDILIEDVRVGIMFSGGSPIQLMPSKATPMSSALYFKSWVGVPFGSPPNGGGGGTGLVRNVTARRFSLTVSLT